MPRIAFGDDGSGAPICELFLDRPMQRLTSTCEVHAGASVLGGRRMEAAASPELDFVPRAEHEALKEKVAKLERALASVLRGDQA